MRHVYRILTANVAISLAILMTASFSYLAVMVDVNQSIATAAAIIFGSAAMVVMRRTIRGYRKGYRSARVRDGGHNDREGWPFWAFGYCFYSGFEAGEREWRRRHAQQ